MPLISSLGVMNAVGFGFTAAAPTAYNLLSVPTGSTSIKAYAYGGDIVTAYTDPVSLPTGNTTCTSNTSDSKNIAVTFWTSPYIHVYPFSDGFGTKFANPATSVGRASYACSFSNANTAIAVNNVAYAWSSAGFGTKFANPSPSPGTSITSLAFNATDSVIYLTPNTSTAPYIYAYAWNNTTGFGTKFANPSSNGVSGAIDMVKVSSLGDIAISKASTGANCFIYTWNNGFGTIYSAPLPSNSGVSSTSFNNLGNVLMASISSQTLRVAALPWTGSGFGARFTDPSSLPTQIVNDIVFDTTDSNVLFGGSIYSWGNTTGFGTLNATSSVTNPAGKMSLTK